MELGFRMIRGCPVFVSPPVESSGIFGLFKELETIQKLIFDIVPTRLNSICPNRNSLACFTTCEKALNGTQCGGKTHWHIIDKRV